MTVAWGKRLHTHSGRCLLKEKALPVPSRWNLTLVPFLKWLSCHSNPLLPQQLLFLQFFILRYALFSRPSVLCQKPSYNILPPKTTIRFPTNVHLLFSLVYAFSPAPPQLSVTCLWVSSSFLKVPWISFKYLVFHGRNSHLTLSRWRFQLQMPEDLSSFQLVQRANVCFSR